MVGAEPWVVGTVEEGANMCWEGYKTSLKCVGNALTVMLVLHVSQVFILISLHQFSVFMSAISQILTIKMSKGTK